MSKSGADASRTRQQAQTELTDQLQRTQQGRKRLTLLLAAICCDSWPAGGGASWLPDEMAERGSVEGQRGCAALQARRPTFTPSAVDAS